MGPSINNRFFVDTIGMNLVPMELLAYVNSRSISEIQGSLTNA